MRNFILFFEGREGTSPVMRLLDGLPGLSVVHHADGSGWEPFDDHNCGPMPLDTLRECLDLLYGPRPIDMARLNDRYLRTAPAPLIPIPDGDAIGFKMRFRPPRMEPSPLGRLPIVGRPARALFPPFRTNRAEFRRMMIEVLAGAGVVVFVAVRQDLLRWALSKYHGDGTGRPGHLQFDLADGSVRREEVPGIRVDCDRLETLLQGCAASHAEKRRLTGTLRRAGIPVFPLLYEEFLADPVGFFQRILARIENDAPAEAIRAVVARGSGFERVHLDDYSTYVLNHRQVAARFPSRFLAWQDAP